jgi:Ankyrin repeats (many copies)
MEDANDIFEMGGDSSDNNDDVYDMNNNGRDGIRIDHEMTLGDAGSGDGDGDVGAVGDDVPVVGGDFEDDDPFNDSAGPDLFEKMMNDSAAFKTNTNSLLHGSVNSLGDQQSNTTNPYINVSGSSFPSGTSSRNASGGGGNNDNMFLEPNTTMDTNEIVDLNPEALLAELDGMEPTQSTLWDQSDSTAQQISMGGFNRQQQYQQQQQQQQFLFRQPNNSSMNQQACTLLNSGRISNFSSGSGLGGSSSISGGFPMQSAGIRPTTALDAAPLNIALGGGLLSRGGASVFSDQGSSSSFQRKGSNPSLYSYNRKGSNPSLHNFNPKANAVFRASKSTSRGFKSSKSEGLLARAMKAKYGSSSQLSSFNMNAELAAAAIAQNSRGSLASVNAGGAGAVASRGTTGAQNATWGPHGSEGGGGRLSRAEGSTSSIQRLLLSHTSNSISSKMSKMTTSESTSALFREKLKLGSSGSRSSMHDLLRQSRKQSKTQSMLRQSSAQSLMRQTSAQSLQNPSGKVDVSSLLRPQHVNSRKSFNRISGMQHENSITGGMNASFDMPTNNSSMLTGQQQQQQQLGGSSFETLLHQSCRLYPTTNAVVESALRVDPDAVRRPVATSTGSGQSKNMYGYPINVALTHGASIEVLKMLVEAGPDVLVKKDGTDGSGSLGIALTAKWDMPVVDLLLSANQECASVADRRGNYPLHFAVSSGSSLAIVKRVLMAYPQAQEMRNFHSQTPLEIAQRSTRVGEDVVGFLQATALSFDGTNGNNNRRSQANLEDGLDDIMKTNFE